MLYTTLSGKEVQLIKMKGMKSLKFAKVFSKVQSGGMENLTDEDLDQINAQLIDAYDGTELVVDGELDCGLMGLMDIITYTAGIDKNADKPES